MRGYKPGRFSFNLKGGRCEACEGDGLIKIEMNFLPDVYIECEECKGKRYNRETLEVKYKGKSIADVLDMSVEEALALFENIPAIRSKLEISHGSASITSSSGRVRRRFRVAKPSGSNLPGNSRRTCDREDTLPARRADDRAPLRRHKETDQGARRTGGERQYRGRDRTQPRRDQICGLYHRYRARRAGMQAGRSWRSGHRSSWPE